jgi:hypothetical protein
MGPWCAAPFEDGDRRPTRSIYAGSIADKQPEPPVYCLECGALVTGFYAAVWLEEWRAFCITHARAIAKKQLQTANRAIRKIQRARCPDGNPRALCESQASQQGGQRMARFWIFAFVSALAARADAADGDMAAYGQGPNYQTQTIHEHLSDSGNETEAIIKVAVPPFPGGSSGGTLADCVITYGKVQTACTPPNPITCSTSQGGLSGAPTVWTTLGDLTDPVTGVSELVLGTRPQTYVRCTNAASTDADCTDVEVVLGCAVYK